jgi:hypothetical protein
VRQVMDGWNFGIVGILLGAKFLNKIYTLSKLLLLNLYFAL